jgi:acyl-CoA synthetase (AMP-forming)/AMP-acid ligase II
MRFAHMQRAARYGMDASSVLLLATPLYSNTTLVAFYPALGAGAHIHLMPKFDVEGYLRLAADLRATHTMLVPVQYRRLMQHPGFDAHDLSSFRMKLCTSAPFEAALKAQVLARWPGDLLEVYGMTEGGGACMLDARAHPGKLHTVGLPAQGHDIRLIDEEGRELPAGPQTVGEVVGRSHGMMTGYHGRPGQTREAEWFDAQGRRYIRTGDVGRFDEDGFLVLMDRRKDMVISGGFNVYPKDLEAVLRGHPEVEDAAVFGVPSARWGETPVACVVSRPGTTSDLAALRDWANERLGRTQRLAALMAVDELPRSAIGKVLKRELRERWLASGPAVE